MIWKRVVYEYNDCLSYLMPGNHPKLSLGTLVPLGKKISFIPELELWKSFRRRNSKWKLQIQIFSKLTCWEESCLRGTWTGGSSLNQHLPGCPSALSWFYTHPILTSRHCGSILWDCSLLAKSDSFCHQPSFLHHILPSQDLHHPEVYVLCYFQRY